MRNLLDYQSFDILAAYPAGSCCWQRRKCSACTMTSVPDILGLTHIAVSSAVQLIVVLKRQVGAYRSLPELLDSAEQKTRRINTSIESLLEFTGAAELRSELFRQTCSDAEEVEQELITIHREICNS